MKHTAEQTTSTGSLSDILLAYYELTKPGITLSVLASMAIGFLLGSAGNLSFLTLFHAVVGTYLIAAGTAAHNQYMERHLDKMMIRTNKRPLPMERLVKSHARTFSLTLIFSGLLYLIFTVNMTAGLVSLATSFVYLVLYTPLKQISFWNVPIGSVAGALPPVGGWAAAGASIQDPGVWILFAIVFLWQIPHVLAIAWLCNDDYTNAGFKMLPKNDVNGKTTGWISLFCLLLLIPVVHALFYLGFNNWVYLVPSLAITGWFTYKGVLFLASPSKETARSLMFASFFYLPAIWIFVLVDKLFFW
jgi:heme o synthase